MVNKKNTISKVKTIVKEDSLKDCAYKIGFDQSVSSGVIGIKGEVVFTDKDGNDPLYSLRDHLRTFEAMLSNSGYLVASQHAPKKNGNSSGVKNNE